MLIVQLVLIIFLLFKISNSDDGNNIDVSSGVLGYDNNNINCLMAQELYTINGWNNTNSKYQFRKCFQDNRDASFNNLDLSGDLDVNGNITSNVIGTDTINATGNITSNDIDTGTIKATGNISSNNIDTGTINASGNITSNDIDTGTINATGNITSNDIDTGNINTGSNITSNDIDTGNINATGNN